MSRKLALLGALVAVSAVCGAAAVAAQELTVTITGPPNPSNASTATFEFTAEPSGNVSFLCSLDGGALEACESPYPTGTLADGPHTFTVDASANPDRTGSSTYEWTIDTAKPTVSITKGPPVTSNKKSGTFEFASDDAAATFECALDTGTYVTCTSPKTYDELADGSHTFRVRAVDAAHNVSEPSEFTWKIDTTGPPAAITLSPPATTPDRSATFEFTSEEAGATFECALDDGAYEPCAAPKTYAGLADGPHTFSVRALDALANAGAPATHAWNVTPLVVVEVPAPPPPPPPTPPPPPDETPPEAAEPVDYLVAYRRVELTWARPTDGDFDHVTVFQRLGSAGARTPVYSGNGQLYEDGKFNNALDYRYEVVSYDRAGNASAPATIAVPASSLLASPRRGARVRRAPTLRWAPIRGARFYNVQLFRNGRKVMSTWPRRPRVRVATSWRYQRRPYRLVRGTYDWYVWPAFRSGRSHRYGPALGHSTFRKR